MSCIIGTVLRVSCIIGRMNISLRKFSADDAARVAELVGDEAVSNWTSKIPYPYSKQDALDWIGQTDLDASRRVFAVELNGQLVACVSYWPLIKGGFEVGYWVGKDYWGKGICSKALELLLSTESFPSTFDVYARIMEGNIRSQRVLEKCGFSFLESGAICKGSQESKAKIYIRRATA